MYNCTLNNLLIIHLLLIHMKATAIILLLAILGIMIFIISIPAIQEAEYAKTHPEFLKNAYDLRKADLSHNSDTIK